jgi:hypothetical protein
MENCLAAQVGLFFAAFGALFSAFPHHLLDSFVRKLVPRYRQSSSGLQKLQKGEEITQDYKELPPLNKLLGSEAQKLYRKNDGGLYVKSTASEIALGVELILNEKDEVVGNTPLLQRELGRKIRDARVYIGLSFMAFGFILQIVGIFLC